MLRAAITNLMITFAAVNRTRSTLELTNRTSVDMDEIKSIMDKNRQPADINMLPLWKNAPMHAQAYNRSREEHLEFARNYAKEIYRYVEQEAPQSQGLS